MLCQHLWIHIFSFLSVQCLVVIPQLGKGLGCSTQKGQLRSLYAITVTKKKELKCVCVYVVRWSLLAYLSCTSCFELCVS